MPFHPRPPVLSVVFVSRGSPLLLQALSCLSTSADQVDGGVEVVVVYDGVRARLPEPALTDGARLVLRQVSLVHSGLAAARNAGWAAARSDLVLFLDEDVFASAGLLSAHLRAHAERPGGLVVGQVIEAPDPMTAWGEHELVAGRRRWRRLRKGKSGPIRVSMSNASLGRTFLESSGGFAGWLPSEEDIELGFRLQASGVPVMFVDAASASRRSRDNFREWRARARTRGRIDVAIYRGGAVAGGTASLLASGRERHPLNRAVISLAFRSPALARPLLGAASGIGLIAHGVGLKRLSRAGLSVVATIEYWSGVREGLRRRSSHAMGPDTGPDAAAARPALPVGR